MDFGSFYLLSTPITWEKEDRIKNRKLHVNGFKQNIFDPIDKKQISTSNIKAMEQRSPLKESHADSKNYQKSKFLECNLNSPIYCAMDGIKRHICEVCQKSFKQKDNLRKHIITTSVMYA